MLQQHFVSLRRRFALLFVLVLIVAGTLAWWGFARLTQPLVEQLSLQYAEKQALYDNIKIRSPILRELALARQLAASPALLRWLGNETDPQLRQNALNEMEAFRQSLHDHSWFVAVEGSLNYYYNDRDNAYANRMPLTQLNRNNPNDSWYFDTLKKIDDYALNVDHDDNTNVTKIWINVIIQEHANKRGIAGTGLDLSEFLLAHVQGNRSGVDTVLIDAIGATQADKDPKAIVLNSFSRADDEVMTYYRYLDNPADRAAVLQAMRSLQLGEKEVATIRVTRAGRQQLIGMAYMPEIKWFNLSVHDVSTLQQQWTLLPLLGFTVLMPLVVVLLLAWFLNRMVLQPVADLANSSERVAGGDYDVTLPITRRDEFGALTESFNRMTAAVRNATTELERKVEQRTQQLQHSNAELEAFTYTVSHDLRAPVRHLAGFLQILRDELGDTASASMVDLLNRMDSACLRLNSLIEGLLSLSRVGHAAIHWSSIDLDQLFTELSQELKPDNVSMRQKTLGHTVGDATLLRQVFANLLSNAIKYSSKSEHPHIEIALAENSALGNETIIVISDNGIGFDPQYRDRLFNVFQRLHNEFAGEGIGLATVAKIVHLHGGRVWADSDGPGKGARFYVALPKTPLFTSSEQKTQ